MSLCYIEKKIAFLNTVGLESIGHLPEHLAEQYLKIVLCQEKMATVILKIIILQAHFLFLSFYNINLHIRSISSYAVFTKHL